MNLNNKIVDIVKKKKILYVMARFIKNINDPDLIKLIKGYYEKDSSSLSIIITHNGTKYPNDVIYHIDMEKLAGSNRLGLFAALRWILVTLNVSDFFGFIPVVEWGKTSSYYDPGMNKITTNVFEYYFNPVSEIDYREIESFNNIVEAKLYDSNYFMKNPWEYTILQDEIELIARIFKKYIHLNKETQEYIETNVNQMIDGVSTLAVHVRGTDYNLGEKGHPIAINPQEILEKTKELYSKGSYDKIFLATDDINILEVFKKELGDKLLYYMDTFRAEEQRGVHLSSDNRFLHHYKLGLEALRDVYTLAYCDALVCGLSQVSFAARYINNALGRSYKEIVVIDNGINKDSSRVKKINIEKSDKE